MIKKFNNLKEIQKYYDEKTSTYVFKENDNYIDLIMFNFDLNIDAHIDASDINARDIKVWNIEALDINARNIHANNIDANNINANNINAWNIDANNINYYEACFAYKNIKCKSIKRIRENANRFMLDENIKSNENDTLGENSGNIIYKNISDLNRYKRLAKEILGGYGGQSNNSIMSNTKEIYIDGKLIGYISFDEYDDVEGYNKVLGFGNFMILDRDKGYGTKVIKDLVDHYKNEYDLIYCFVDTNNLGAINLYKKLGEVYDEDGPNDNGQYYVTFWDKKKN